MCLVCFCASADSIDSNIAVKLNIRGPIGPATQEYVTHGIENAQKRNADAVILQVDTPGGLSSAMRGIIQVMLGSDIPIIAYVSPSAARAASAGTYILYAAGIAAMAPGTNLGAATPVNLTAAKTKVSAEKMKALNDAKAYIRSLAQLRGRNVHWAEDAVQKASSLSATEALQKNVIDMIAPNVKALLNQLNNKRIPVANGRFVTLNTKDMTVLAYQPNWRTNLLAIISNPMIAYILLMIAFYGLFLEFAHPGFILPGVLGGVALLLGLYGLQMLPVSYVGLALIFLGFVLLIAELFIVSFGMLGLGGIASFVIGSILLMDTGVVGFMIPWQLILGFAIATALFVIIVLQMLVRVRRRPEMSGYDVLIGQTGIVLVDGKKIWARVNGELWEIDNHINLQSGDQVEIKSVKGMKIFCKKLNNKEEG